MELIGVGIEEGSGWTEGEAGQVFDFDTLLARACADPFRLWVRSM